MLIMVSTGFAEVPTQAFLPESGFYWNPDQPGRGYAIEVQDRSVFMTAYVYSEESNPSNRAPLWFSAAGLVSRQGGSQVTYRLNSELAYSGEGQCLNCPYVAPVTENTGRNLTITFTSPITASMVIDGEAIELVRFWYSNSISSPIFAMFGQWMVVTDYTDVDTSSLPFDGDLLEMGFLGSSDGQDTAEGFRGGTAIPVVGTYSDVDDFYVIVVAENTNRYLAYYFTGIQFGTSHFYGLAERFTPGANLTGNGFPAQGQRISDRTHTESVLQAKRVIPDGPVSERPVRRPGDKSLPGISAERLNKMVRQLESQLELLRQ